MLLAFTVPGVPEIPNFLTFLHKYFYEYRWVDFLYAWSNIFFSFFTAVLISLIFYFGSRKKEFIPSPLQNFLEYLAEILHNVIVSIIGPEGEKYVPFLGTLFIYILSMNLLGLVPLLKSPSSSINITAALAICVFALVQYLNVKNMGVTGYLYHLAGSPKGFIGWLVTPLMFPIEVLTQLSRPITLALRLAGNILGEKILVGFFALFSVAWLLYIPAQTPFLFLGVLTSLMQALVFTLLSAVYILLSVPHDEEENHH